MDKCTKTLRSCHTKIVSLIVATTATLVLLTTSTLANANLIRNPSFENVPGSVAGQGLMPNEWDTVFASPDTYSNDGSYGLFPEGFTNFPGVGAYDGKRWVAGWSSSQERFGQLLTAPLIAGQDYTFSGYMHQALRSDLDNPGGYDLYLWNSSTDNTDAVFLGFIGSTSPGGWDLFTLDFTAPDNASAVPFLTFDPVATGVGGAYPGLDMVSLTAAVPLPATVWLFGSGLMLLAGISKRPVFAKRE